MVNGQSLHPRLVGARRGPGKRTRAEADGGAVAVEAALIIPFILLPILFGIIGFGVFLSEQLSLTNGARQAARVGVVNSADATCLGLLTEVRDSVGTLNLKPQMVKMTVTVGGVTKCTPALGTGPDGLPAYNTSNNTAKPCLNSSTNAELKVDVTYDSTLGVFGIIFGDTTVTMDGKGVYRCEYN